MWWMCHVEEGGALTYFPSASFFANFLRENMARTEGEMARTRANGGKWRTVNSGFEKWRQAEPV